MVSLKDIAREVSLSVSVVSRVLNPAPDANSRISPQTRQLVLNTAERLGYQCNRNAEFMSRNKSAAIGVFIPEYANSLIAELLFGISEAANIANFPISIHTGLTEQSYYEFIHSHCNKMASGMISYSVRQYQLAKLEDALEEYHSKGGQLLLLNDLSEKRFTSLSMDETEGGHIAAQFLLEHECKRYFSLLKPGRQKKNISNIDALRTRSFLKTMADAGVRADFCPPEEILSRLVNERAPCGIFAGSDIGAIRLLQEARKKNLEAGQDYFLVGYDNLNMAELIDPPLTTIAQPFREEGRRAVEKLIRMIYGKKEENEIIAPIPVRRQTA